MKSTTSAARFLHPVTNAEALPAVHAVRNDTKARKYVSKRFSNLGRPVPRAVIDNENFRLSSQNGEEGCDLFESCREA